MIEGKEIKVWRIARKAGINEENKDKYKEYIFKELDVANYDG